MPKSSITNVFNALGDPSRYRLIQLLRQNPDLCVSELAKQVGISPAGVSQHMKILESAGLVLAKRQGQKMCFKLQESSNRKVLELIEI